MSVLKDVREEVAQLLSAISGQRAYPYLPESVAVPAWTVVDGDNYLSPGDTFGSLTVRHDVLFYTSNAANSVGTAALDEELEGAVVALVNAGWDIESVQIEALRANGSEYLGAAFTITKNIRF